MKVGIIGDPHGHVKYPVSFLRQADIFLVPGDIGKADFARNRFFENQKRLKKGLPELEYTPKDSKFAYMEIYNSTIKFLKMLSKYGRPIFTIRGNVESKDSETRKEAKKHSIKLPLMTTNMLKIKNVNLLRNQIRNINGLRIGGLEHFIDTCWVREFKPGDFKDRMKRAKRETDKAKKVLKWFGEHDLDILLCHSPPYGFLDKVSGKYGAPKHFIGKHAGSKAILDYIKRKQPGYVFCGHIHEGKGMRKIGKSKVYNVGLGADHLLLDIE